jgi:hypothetical protein
VLTLLETQKQAGNRTVSGLFLLRTNLAGVCCRMMTI